jgi:hypothetical protein
VDVIYRRILAIHLCTGIFCLAFLAMYGWSAVQMAHRRWFPLQDRVSEQRYTLVPGLSDVRSVARLLPLRGELQSIRLRNTGFVFTMVRPGLIYVVNYAPENGAVTVQTHDSGIGGTLNRIHQTQGLWHGYRILNLWAAFLGLASLGLLLLGATGLYLWFRNRRERLVGAILVAGGSGLAVVLIGWMRAG